MSPEPTRNPDKMGVLLDCLERFPDPLALCEIQTTPSPASSVVFVNRAFEALTGRNASATVGQEFLTVLTPVLDEAAVGRIQELVRSGWPRSIEHLYDKTGSHGRHFELRVAPVSEGARGKSRWLFLLRDTTIADRHEHHLEHDRDRWKAAADKHAGQLEAAQDLQQRNECLLSLGVLAAGLGHDMSNLLLPMRAHLEALEACALEPNAKYHLQEVHRVVLHLRQLKDSLRLFALDPGDADASTGTTDLAEWWNLLRPLIAHAVPSHVQMDVDLPEGLPPVGVAAHRLTQSVLNLIINATDAITGKGTIRFWASRGDREGFVRVGVTDTGRGMTRKTKEHAFDPFFTTKKRGRSTGLGLSIVYGLVRSAGGSVHIDSAPGRGTTVVLDLPAAREAVARNGRAKPGPKAVASVSIRDQRVAACFTTLLSAVGFQVRQAPPGNPGPVSLWVTEASTKSLAAARKWRDTRVACPIIVFGSAPDEWRNLAAVVVDKDGGLSAIREAIRSVVVSTAAGAR